MMDEEVRTKEHIRVGTILLEAVERDPTLVSSYSIFEIVRHLNYSIPTLTDTRYDVMIDRLALLDTKQHFRYHSAILKLLQLNTSAAQKANLSTAPDTGFNRRKMYNSTELTHSLSAISYLNCGLELINKVETPWQTSYETCFNLYFELGQSYYFTSNFAK